ncbi:unnamed protein product [Closterium sp. NIES-64]|nr:unnamed protein product [Closterium sp. NIES-64]
MRLEMFFAAPNSRRPKRKSRCCCPTTSKFRSQASRANILKMWRHAIAVRVGRLNEVEQCTIRSPRASLGFSPLRPKPVAKPPSKKPRPRDVMGTAAAVKPRAVHSGQATVAAAAAKATPVKATPVKATQAKATPAKATQAKATEAKATPAKVTPAKETPAKAAFAKATPATPAKATRAINAAVVDVKAAGASSPAVAAAAPLSPKAGVVGGSGIPRPASSAAPRRVAAGATASGIPKPGKGVVGEMGGEVGECGELEWGGMA